LTFDSSMKSFVAELKQKILPLKSTSLSLSH